jgi:hypothetical protein
LLTKLSNPDERKSTKVVSHAHIWELWKGFPHYPRPSPPIMDGPMGFVMVWFHNNKQNIDLSIETKDQAKGAK